MIAALLRRGPSRWRSRQLYERLICPPTNHFANGSSHSQEFLPRLEPVKFLRHARPEFRRRLDRFGVELAIFRERFDVGLFGERGGRLEFAALLLQRSDVGLCHERFSRGHRLFSPRILAKETGNGQVEANLRERLRMRTSLPCRFAQIGVLLQQLKNQTHAKQESTRQGRNLAAETAVGNDNGDHDREPEQAVPVISSYTQCSKSL